MFTVGGALFTVEGAVFRVGGAQFTVGGAVFTVGGAHKRLLVVQGINTFIFRVSSPSHAERIDISLYFRI